MIVHQQDDVAFLESIGVTENVSLVPIGCEQPCDLDMQEMRSLHDVDSRASVIGTFGFLLPHKGTLDLIRALPALRATGKDVRLIAVTALHPDPSSAAYRDECVAEIRRLNLGPFVSLKTEYLPESTARELLAACDVIALPYGETRESSSAALRSVLPIGRPILVSDVPIFDDAREVLAYVLSPVDPVDLAEGLERLLDPDGPGATLAAATEDFCVRHSWASTAAATRQVYEDILEGSRPSAPKCDQRRRVTYRYDTHSVTCSRRSSTSPPNSSTDRSTSDRSMPRIMKVG